MQLSKDSIHSIQHAEVPSPDYFQLPEKVLQFGTGVLLRGLPDYYIDRANKQGVFNGRVVVVKSTGGDVLAFEEQDSLFAHCIYGIRNGQMVKDHVINASISRVLSAKDHWTEILRCARDPQMQVVISNTTEVGISFINESVHAQPPVSFPGKLLAFLLERYNAFKGDGTKGMVIVPTELVPDNGMKLRDILVQLADANALEVDFKSWLTTANHFCSSLVDRIVPGRLPQVRKEEMESMLGVTDNLMIISEPYSLWAIESRSEQVKETLSFYRTDKSVHIVPDITIFRELKLRLLNGSHTLCCGLAYLAGFDTVRQAMEDGVVPQFMSQLMHEEIIPAITSDQIPESSAAAFAADVLDRFRNPFIEHQLLSITLQYSSKMAMRNVPILKRYVQQFNAIPERVAVGLAAHILFLKGRLQDDGKYYGQRNGQPYPITDDNADFYAACWKSEQPAAVVSQVLANEKIWGSSLLSIDGLAEKVNLYLEMLIKEGPAAVIRARTYKA